MTWNDWFCKNFEQNDKGEVDGDIVLCTIWNKILWTMVGIIAGILILLCLYSVYSVMSALWHHELINNDSTTAGALVNTLGIILLVLIAFGVRIQIGEMVIAKCPIKKEAETPEEIEKWAAQDVKEKMPMELPMELPSNKKMMAKEKPAEEKPAEIIKKTSGVGINMKKYDEFDDMSYDEFNGNR